MAPSLSGGVGGDRAVVCRTDDESEVPGPRSRGDHADDRGMSPFAGLSASSHPPVLPTAGSGASSTVCLPSCHGLLPTFCDSSVAVYVGDSLRLLGRLPDACVDSVVTDPPYAIRKVPDVHGALAGAASCCESCGTGVPVNGLRVCGGCLVDAERSAFGDASMLGMQSENWQASETHSRGYADSDPSQFAAWCGLWASECLRVLRPGGHLVAFGGTRTWHRLGCAVEDCGFEIRDSLAWLYARGFPKGLDVGRALLERTDGLDSPLRETVLEVAARYQGWGTGLRPAHEPIVLARKALDGTVSSTVAAWGTGALNLGRTPDAKSEGTRWPGNVYLDQQQASVLDGAATGSPSRFFFVAKPDRRERVSVGGVTHPTVKPLSLMRALVNLTTPAGGIVLDPFAGSGTTVEAAILEGRRVLAIEREPEYLPLIRQRIERRRETELGATSHERVEGLLTLFDTEP